MRKFFFSLMVIGPLLGGISQKAQAQDKVRAFNLNIGTVTHMSFGDVYFTLGVGFDSQIGEYIMISPEIQLLSNKFRFDSFPILPGIILNLKLKNFFVGTGVIFPFRISGDGGIKSGNLAAKINAGFRINRLKLTLYLITPFENLFEENLLGASIGIVF